MDSQDRSGGRNPGQDDGDPAPPQGGAGHRRLPVPRRIPDRPAGAEPGDQPRHRGRRHRAEQGPAAADGPRRVRARRHSQSVHREGDPQRRRRHRRARRGGVLRAALGRQGGAEGTQRDGRDPAVRRLSEGAVGAPGHPQVDLRGVRLERMGSGAVHRGPSSTRGHRARVSPATASTSRATRVAWRVGARTSR